MSTKLQRLQILQLTVVVSSLAQVHLAPVHLRPSDRRKPLTSTTRSFGSSTWQIKLHRQPVQPRGSGLSSTLPLPSELLHLTDGREAGLQHPCRSLF